METLKGWALMPSYLAKLFADLSLPKWALALATGALDYVFGSSVLVSTAAAALALLVLDTITGIMAAYLTGKTIESNKLGRVLVKTVGYGCSILVASIVTRQIPTVEGAHGITVTVVVSFILLTEAVSVMENLGRMGFNKLGFLTKHIKGRLTVIVREVEEPEELDPKPAKRVE